MTDSDINNIADPFPLLSSIDSPADLRRLRPGQLPEVCAELRRFIISELSHTPGHFASSMGAVDITVALHYVFNTPYDRIVWDVGHQAYAHKILTGRRDKFHTLRTLGGLSGFPNPDESPYDTFAAGHASNSISAALGFAIASQLKNESPRRNIVAVIGDASISGGLAFEALNNASNIPNNLLIVLNDNDMSIDRNVGGLNSYLARITASQSYNNLRYRLFKIARRLHLVSDNRRNRLLRFNNSVKSVLTKQQNIFEGLNIRYFGPFDGNDVATTVRVLSAIKDMDGPRILHLRTTKGKGFAPAENDPAHWHAPGIFDPESGQRQTKKSALTKYQDVLGLSITDEATADKRIVAITAAMLSGTSLSTMQEKFPDRVFDVGISEGHAVTFASGLAKEGLRPVVAIYSSFLQRAYDHIVNDVALIRQPVVFAIDRAGLVGEDGPTHHGALDLAYLNAVPGMIVSAPSGPAMLTDLLHTALAQDKAPFAIRYPRGASRQAHWQHKPVVLPIGKGLLRHPSVQNPDAIILSIGTIAEEVDDAIAILAENNIHVRHYDMIFLKPLDTDILREVAAYGFPVVTVEDASRVGGLGSTVAAWMAENAPGTKVTSLGIPDNFCTHGTPAQLKEICKIDARSIAATIIELSRTTTNSTK